MGKSYSQKVDAIYKVLEKNPNTSATQIYNRFKGTDYGMRKTDSLEFTKLAKTQIQQQADFKKKLDNSDVTAGTKRKLLTMARQQGYKYAKYSAKKGKGLLPKNAMVLDVNTLRKNTFSGYPQNIEDYVTFYDR